MAVDSRQQAEPGEPICEGLRSRFGRESLASVNVGRDEQDGYTVNVELAGGELAPRLTRADVIALLPAGSSWLPAVGWHSYFGIPFGFEGRTWLAVGAEVVNRHASRGAYVSFCAFVFAFERPPVRQLARFAEELNAARPAPERDRPGRTRAGHLRAPLKLLDEGKRWLGLHDRRVIRAKSATPAEHARVEAHILREAAEAYARGELLLFRTLALSENQLERHEPPRRGKKTVARLQIHYYKYLAATVPAISDAFSSRAKHT